MVLPAEQKGTFETTFLVRDRQTHSSFHSWWLTARGQSLAPPLSHRASSDRPREEGHGHTWKLSTGVCQYGKCQVKSGDKMHETRKEYGSTSFRFELLLLASEILGQNHGHATWWNLPLIKGWLDRQTARVKTASQERRSPPQPPHHWNPVVSYIYIS